MTKGNDKKTVKIDEDLLKRVKTFVKANKIRYPSVKHFVNLAVLDFLEKEKKKVNL